MVADSLFSMDKIGARPSMDPQRTVSGPHWRIGIITDRLIRFEWSDTDEFVDDATQIVLNRSFGDTPKFRVTRRDGRVLIDTDAVRITYDEKPFSRAAPPVHSTRSTVLLNWTKASQHSTGGL